MFDLRPFLNYLFELDTDPVPLRHPFMFVMFGGFVSSHDMILNCLVQTNDNYCQLPQHEIKPI